MTESRGLLHKLELCLNTINHALIGICVFYNMWYFLNYGFDKPHVWHAFWCSTGFQLLMAEGILAMYSGNSFTLFASRTNKKWLHGLLQATGGTFGLIGFFLEIVQRSQANKRLFHIWHARMGLVAAIFLGLSVLSGCAALFPKNLKSLIRPVYMRFFHNLFGIVAFVFGFIGMIIAYNTRSFARDMDPGNMRYCIIGFLCTILAITLLGPLKACFRYTSAMFDSPPSEIKSTSKEEIVNA